MSSLLKPIQITGIPYNCILADYMVRIVPNIFHIGQKWITMKSMQNLNNLLRARIHECSPIIFEKSLVYWTLQHFKNDQRYQTHPTNISVNKSNNEIEIVLKNSHTLALLDINELLSYMMFVSNDIIKDREMIVKVDQELCKRLCDENYNTNCNDVLRISDTLLYFTHNRRSMMNSYTMCIESIRNILRCSEMTLQNFIQCTFYTSILKDTPLTRAIMNIILRKIHMQTIILNTISPIELSIFCNAVYKTSTKIKSKKILKAIVEAIQKDSHTLFMNPLLGISILKTIHQAKYKDYKFLDKLSSKILNKNGINVETYDFTGVVYLLKLFTNALYNDELLISYLSDLAINKLKYLYENKKYIRAKDISTLLKSFCELGSDSLKPKVIDSIMPIMYNAVESKNIQRNELKSFMDMLLWICVLDPSILDTNFLNNSINANLIKLSKKDLKGITRMNLLISILSIEQLLLPDKQHQLMQWIEPTVEYDFSLLSSRRPKLYEIYQAVQCLSSTNTTGIKSYSLQCQVPNLYIPGITVQTSSCRKIAIESLDEKVCLHESLIPDGYMKLKLRLLTKLGYEVITIPQNIIDEGSEHLFVKIDDCIKRIEEKQRPISYQKKPENPC